MTQAQAIRPDTGREPVPMIQKVPASLKEVKDAVGLGLFYLAIGDKPTAIPAGDAVSVRFTLSAKAQQYLEQVLPDYRSAREALIAALAVVAEKPRYVRETRI